jgi:galactokinase
VSATDPAADDPAERHLGLEGGEGTAVRAFAPGRVNLIGEHTDYAGGLALPMAVHLGTTVTGVRGDDRVVLASADEPEPADLALSVAEPDRVEPAWARYVAGVVALSHPAVGLTGEVSSTLPIGAGLSSSAALEVAAALALGVTGTARQLAELARRAEQEASGVPCGLMDQLAATCGVAGHALLMDFGTGTVRPVPVPEGLEVVVVHSGRSRRLAGSAYAQRRHEIEAALALLGPLADVGADAVAGIADPVLRRRARHVVTENERVRATVEAFGAGDLAGVGRLVDESHASLRDDAEVSTPELDALCDDLRRVPGVHGARLTGAGFGGCVVAVGEPGALDRGWVLRPAPGAHVESR